MSDGKELQQLIERSQAGDIQAMTDFFGNAHPADIADIIDLAETEQAQQFFAMLDVELQAETIGYLEEARQLQLVLGLSRRDLARLFTEMNSDERADLYQELPEGVQESLMPALATAEREDLRRLTSYPEGSVGSIMTSDYATLHPSLSAKRAIEALRAQALDKETIYVAYVLDENRQLIGTVSLTELVLANAQTKVEQVMRPEPVWVSVDASPSDASRMVADYDLLALPVLDANGMLVGIVTHDDAFDVQEEQATEIMHKASSVGAMVGSIKTATFSMLYQKRIYWLVLLVFGNLLSGLGIAMFEDTIAANVVLVFFLPLLVGSAGNAGSQAATLMVRALSTGDVEMRDWASMLLKEVSVSLALGITMALTVSMIGFWRGGVDIAMVVALTMMLVVVVGSLIGMCLPFILSKLNFDPATASGPLITTIADAAGVVIYFAIAVAILPPLV